MFPIRAICKNFSLLFLLLWIPDRSERFRNDLEPVTVGIVHEVDVHLGIFVADAAHFLVTGMGRIIIIDLECQMKFVVAKIVRLFPIFQPCQFQLMGTVPVLQIDDDKTPVFRFYSPHLVHIKGFPVEFQALLKVEHVEIIVNHTKFHKIVLLVFAIKYNRFYKKQVSHSRDDQGNDIVKYFSEEVLTKSLVYGIIKWYKLGAKLEKNNMPDDCLEYEPLYEKLRKKLLEQIETEHLTSLPNEKELMTRYHVSRNTLRRAILELTKAKILCPVQGIGTLVKPVSDLKADSLILLIYDVSMPVYQQEIFHELLFRLGQSRLRTSVLMVDKENVDVAILKSHLKECDAVIIDMACSFSPVIREQVARCGKKRICLRWDATRFQFPSVETDLTEGVYLLTKHLLALGHRKFLLLINADDMRRMSGFLRALEEAGLDSSAYRIIPRDRKKVDRTRRFDMEQARKMLAVRTNETAILCNNDCLALCVEELLLADGVRIPEDVSVVGFDNIADSADFPVPLTTCSGKMEELIREAIAYLFSNRKPNEMFYKKIMPELVIRQSTGPVKQL